jgi:quercetin dioxygenase-like cupin family protein
MQYTRIYTDERGNSRFEDVAVDLESKGPIGSLSEAFEVRNLIFRETPPDYDYDDHHAPDRQFVILLDGLIEVEISSGEKRVFTGGEILLVEDTHGKGHKTKALLKNVRRSIFVTLK